MSNLMEVFQGHNEHPALFQERDVLESLPPQMIRDFIEELRIKKAELERLEELALGVLDGYGEVAA
ncbi:hypothetical protein J2X12_003470 [Pseudarthrobacter oxydans]|uniref:Uncharacterized protein n=1 Tax=Pseudarthrobacter oxydans TaxID=1671 RepID=A0AAW8ND12_PSEOX|nr:hypothetical protein [Pseudarthrobacter oxydans]MDR6794201.1 hypothetical protein [Pseudarthrobacter oxydans]MDR7165421.1 hypothetical protein [Pseudarthrobacter oxydans]